jgi:hypothetical protein
MPFNGTNNLLFSGQTTNADSPTVRWSGGRGAFFARGTFGGGSVTLQFKPDGDPTWFNVDRPGEAFVTFTAQGGGQFDLPSGDIRATLTGATSPNIHARLEEIKT